LKAVVSRALIINKITALKTATPATTKAVITTILQAAVDIIGVHNNLKPTPTEIAALKTHYASFNNKIYALLTNKTLINQSTKKLIDASLKTQLKIILDAMSAAGFPELTTAQKNLMSAVKKANP
jgi:homoserine dehydrogenase